MYVGHGYANDDDADNILSKGGAPRTTGGFFSRASIAPYEAIFNTATSEDG